MNENLKIRTVIDKNTFYFFSKEFENQYEGHLNALSDTLGNLHSKIKKGNLEKEHIEDLLVRQENGLNALLALTGVSNESLKRIVTLIRVTNDEELSNLVCKNEWSEESEVESVREWTDKKIAQLINKNEFFRKGIVNLFFEGSTVPFLVHTVPLFELRKLSCRKLKFDMPEIIDTLVRYKEKGSYAGKSMNNAETMIENLLENMKVLFTSGGLDRLKKVSPQQSRDMDFIIPNQQDPRIIVESSFMATTSSNQGDKAKTEISMGSLIKKKYPRARFIGFVDGIGWYVRRGDLSRMVGAYDEVFTFHPDEMRRFEEFLRNSLGNGDG